MPCRRGCGSRRQPAPESAPVPLLPLKENLGHTKLEVLVGSVMGPAVALPGLVLIGSPIICSPRVAALLPAPLPSVTPTPSGAGAAWELTADQRAALEDFAAWLTAPADGSPFVQQGYAGTGKDLPFGALSSRW